MLLYRPLIIDWLPVPLPHPLRPNLHPLRLCLLVSLSPSSSPPSRFPPHHVSFSSHLFLCLSFFPSFPLFFFSCPSSGPAASGPVAWCISILRPLVSLSACGVQAPSRVHVRSSRPLLVTHLSSSSPLSSGPRLRSPVLDVGLSCFVPRHSGGYL